MKYRLFPYLAVLFAVTLVLSNTVAVKLVPFGPFVWTAAIVIFPISYILGDVVTEVYGYAGARKVFWLGLGANLLMVAVYAITASLPSLDPEFGGQYATVLAQVPRMVVASMAGVWCGQFANAFVLSRLKVLTRGRWLWSRTIPSTFVGETVDTAVFALLAFAFTVPWGVVWQIVWSAALFKTAYEVAVTPLTYAAVAWCKRVEGAEVFDWREDYNPFAVGRQQGEVRSA